MWRTMAGAVMSQVLLVFLDHLEIEVGAVPHDVEQQSEALAALAQVVVSRRCDPGEGFTEDLGVCHLSPDEAPALLHRHDDLKVVYTPLLEALHRAVLLRDLDGIGEVDRSCRLLAHAAPPIIFMRAFCPPPTSVSDS